MEKTGMTITHIGGPKGCGVVGRDDSRIQIENGSWLASSTINDLFKPDSSLHTRASQTEYGEESVILCLPCDLVNVRRFVERVSFNEGVNSENLFLVKHCTWVSTSPFAVLIVSTLRGGQLRTQNGIRIVWPRQIHEGELGRSIPVPPLKIVTSAVNGNDPKNVSWVALAELAEVAHLGLVEIVANFLHLHIFSMNNQPEYVCAANEADLASGRFQSHPLLSEESFRVTGHTHEQPVIDAQRTPNDIWVEATVAKNILRLISLGVRNGKEDIFPHHAFM